MRAYDESYLWDAMNTLGEAFDCAFWRADLSLQRFFDLFVSTGLARRFGLGDPALVAGMSGAELVLRVGCEAGLDIGIAVIDDAQFEETPEYWCGWILAYYQWKSGRPFADIGRIASMGQVLALYQPLHEAPEEKFCEIMERIARSLPPRLKEIRQERGFSQAQLAERSGVGIRAIQQYEQRVKDINHAQAGALYRMAASLGCTMEDLLEFPLEPYDVAKPMQLLYI